MERIPLKTQAIYALIFSIFLSTCAAQHVCVYCRGATEAPDQNALRIACARNVSQPLTCNDTGVLPDCDDASVFEPVGRDLPDGCNVLQQANTTPVSQGQLQLIRLQYVSFECYDSVLFQGLRWGLRAVIMDPACPDQGSIWTECSYSSPLCQTRAGVRPVNMSTFIAAGEPLAAVVGPVPAAEAAGVREIPPVMEAVVPSVVAPAPEPISERPATTILPQTTLPAGGSMPGGV